MGTIFTVVGIQYRGKRSRVVQVQGTASEAREAFFKENPTFRLCHITESFVFGEPVDTSRELFRAESVSRDTKLP